MKNIVSIAEKLHEARTVPVIIEGETGTGKEVIAKLIHFGSKKVGTAPFIPINCSAIAANLFETELFGYEAGAFSGAGTPRTERQVRAGPGRDHIPGRDRRRAAGVPAQAAARAPGT